MKITGKNYIIFLILLVVSLIPRIYKYQDAPLYTDEVTWMVRSKETFLAVRTFNPLHIKNYFKSGNAWWNDKKQSEAISLPLAMITGPFISYLGIGQSVLTRNVTRDYIAARFPLIIINSLTVLVVYLLSVKIVGRKIGFLTSVLYALDPIVVANSRLVMNDGLLSLFIVSSLYSYFYIKDRFKSVIFTSLSLCLSFLTKPLGVLPVIVFLIYIFFVKDKKEYLVRFILIGLLTFLFIHVFWPEALFKPVVSIFEYLVRQLKFTNNAEEMFFLGKISYTVPFYYYFVILIFRLPSYITIGLIVSIYYLIKFLITFANKKKNKWKVGEKYLILYLLGFFVILFFTLVSMSVKKSGIRYLLPIYPFIYIAGVWGINEIIQRYRFLKPIGYFVLVTIAVINLVRYSPSYDYYVSEISGGPKNAMKNISTSLCYGSKESADYINKCFPQIGSISYIGCARSTLPYYFSKTIVSPYKDSTPLVIEEHYNQMGYAEKLAGPITGLGNPIMISKNRIVLARLYNFTESDIDSCRKQ